ncbi:hypothetical protein DM860_007719 [Cuscuta australis]|uniref:Protein ECERIFERUM 26-like n=1 Tax=Cuscuta australis TaxID=267555 RepID=A0A328E906_9ASTE|nr:hypothetical protein DM860_007719 [Cuscuta australis]
MSEFLSMAKRTAVSTIPVQPGKFIPLSVLDRAMQHNIIRVVFYYRKFDKMVQLHESISETLNAFPNITGRLMMRSGEEEKWVLKCNDAGLRVIEAKVKGSVDEWLRDVDREKEFKLAHWEPMPADPYFWSPFYLQITEFEGGGAAIGLSCTHLLADPIAATLFIRAWADMSAFAGKMLSPPHVHPLPLRTPLDKNPHNPHQTHACAGRLIEHYKLRTRQNQSPSHISPAKQTATITLLFPDEVVRRCMLMAQTVPCGGGPFEALVGLFWTRITKAKKVGLMDLVVGFDARKVLGLDKGFFGNCMVYNKVPWNKGSMDFEDEDLLSESAMAITNVMKGTDRESVIGLIEWLEQNNGQSAGSNVLFDGRDSLLVCANLEELDSYSACFGGHFEPPVHVSYYIEPDVGPVNHRLVIILPSPGTGPLSRTVMVTLPEDEVGVLMEDQLIQQLSPSVKMMMRV